MFVIETSYFKKNTIMNAVYKIIIALIFISSIYSCKTSSLSLKVLEPAEINIPQNINSIVIMNRSVVGKGKKIENFVEGLLTGEDAFVDRYASENCVASAASMLSNSIRFKLMLPPENIVLEGKGGSRFPEPVDWSIVEQICKKSKADALITLELFDSDITYSNGKETNTSKVDGEDVVEITFWKKMDVQVAAGWRIYDYKNKLIVDESIFTDYKEWIGEGNSEGDAEDNLIDSDEAVESTGSYAGERFAFRISPIWVWKSRKYYKKGHPEFEEAHQFALKADWDKAAEYWKPLTNSSERKIAAMACYNMALYSEINGNLDVAIIWIKKAYYELNFNPAFRYMNELFSRKHKEEKLDEQLN